MKTSILPIILTIVTLLPMSIGTPTQTTQSIAETSPADEKAIFPAQRYCFGYCAAATCVCKMGPRCKCNSRPGLACGCRLVSMPGEADGKSGVGEAVYEAIPLNEVVGGGV
ncbi:hypothetical protein BDV25DRAFT_135182 [Aspergillus avenaceus]|uniref:Invertebrate defensins family profile domain-containing protein n=1 Tax=Aspergillus avenaceus TaxID=36643 RepID=A0A5N6U940_ASPAV|nr:hypothetical protein BDV25DRAFT_135182 [Aspergillus avenaceus]